MINTKFKFIACVTAAFIAAPFSAQAIDNEAVNSRMEKLERDLMLLQRQISRSGGSSSSSDSGSVASGSADTEVRLSAMEEQMRSLAGKTEENQFQVKKLAENMDKFQKDTDFRFNEIAHGSGSAAQTASTGNLSTKPTSPASQPAVSQGAEKAIQEGERKIPGGNPQTQEDKNAKSVGKTVDMTAESSHTEEDTETDSDALSKTFESPREHYNYAFRLLNQTQYDKAASFFATFIKKYPKDSLIGNAYYWQGETFYIRRDYVKAADSFREGFESSPGGSKAPDNLLKLAMTLDALKRKKEACVVLSQVVAKFNEKSAAVAQKAVQEQKRIACK